MNSYLFITDLHLKPSAEVREGDLLDDLCNKLSWCVDYANAKDATILLGGDIFDKPSVPDMVKNRVIPILLKAKYKPISISGNHDQLYGNDDYNYKISYQVLVSAGIITDVTARTIVNDGVVITNELPVKDQGKPQIVLYHGFLNQDDGKWTLHFQDIESGIKNSTYICLGHDHTVYEPLAYTDKVKIFRPGSFQRTSRDEASYRTPQALHIHLSGDKLQYKMVDIKCRPAEEVFKTKLLNITKAQQSATYEDIISQIRNANVGNLTFKQALSMVAPEGVVDYAERLLTDYRMQKAAERQNL